MNPVVPWLRFLPDGVMIVDKPIISVCENNTPKISATVDATQISLKYTGDSKTDKKLKEKHPYDGQVGLGKVRFHHSTAHVRGKLQQGCDMLQAGCFGAILRVNLVVLIHFDKCGEYGYARGKPRKPKTSGERHETRTKQQGGCAVSWALLAPAR